MTASVNLDFNRGFGGKNGSSGSAVRIVCISFKALKCSEIRNLR